MATAVVDWRPAFLGFGDLHSLQHFPHILGKVLFNSTEAQRL